MKIGNMLIDDVFVHVEMKELFAKRAGHERHFNRINFCSDERNCDS